MIINRHRELTVINACTVAICCISLIHSADIMHLIYARALASPAIGHCMAHAPAKLAINCLILSGHFTDAQTLTLQTRCRCLPRNNTQAYSSDMIYCINFIIFSCVTRKLFSLSFVPLLAPNPVDAIVLVFAVKCIHYWI